MSRQSYFTITSYTHSGTSYTHSGTSYTHSGTAPYMSWSDTVCWRYSLYRVFFLLFTTLLTYSCLSSSCLFCLLDKVLVVLLVHLASIIINMVITTNPTPAQTW